VATGIIEYESTEPRPRSVATLKGSTGMATLDPIEPTPSRPLRDVLLLLLQVALLAVVVAFALFPLLEVKARPTTLGGWFALIVPTAAVVVAATIVFFVGIRGRQQRIQLARAYEDLRIAVASGLVGDEALRVSVAQGKVGANRLRASLARGKVGDENLRIAVASGLVGDENLRVAVASGLEGDENLRAAVASGLVGDENLRAAVASGLIGDENLRIAVASGLEGDENLRIAVASGLEGDENLRIAVASGLVGDENLRIAVASGIELDESLRASVASGLQGAERLRISLADGIVGAEALRVSVADGIDGAEALRVSVAQGLDAASAALAVVDTVDAGITFYGPDGAILLTNDTARALVESGDLDPATGVRRPMVFEDDRVTEVPDSEYVLARAARGQVVTRRAYWVGTREHQRAIMATSQFVRRASGDFLGTVVATHDVTPLAEAIHARDEFLETVSHELRTPLTSIIGYLEVIRDMVNLTESGIQAEFQAIERNSQRLLKLIVDLLLTAEGQATVERRPFDIAELARNSLNAVRPAAEARDIRLIDSDLHSVLAEVDADRIGDVLDKLVSNALKFSSAGCTVSVGVVRDDSEVVVTVTDDGTGIGADDQLHIFERFYRSSIARTGVVPGAGLGLSTAKVIVDSHHGSITVQSELGVGSTFELRLPLVA
jgi:signal transduction histidine kinase